LKGQKATMSRLNDILLDLQPTATVTPLRVCLDKEDTPLSSQLDAAASIHRRPRRYFIHSVDDEASLAAKRQKVGDSTMTTAVDATSKESSSNASSASKAGTKSTELALYQQQWQNLQQSPPNVSGRSMEKMRSLRRLYLHGLQTVQKLQDLRHAPDAILPGNFYQHEGL
jgi:hypothetical protein